MLTRAQRDIFDAVKTFILNNREKRSASPLAMLNTVSARDRKFITTLGEDLHLSVTWDEYDEDDQNLITLRLPGESQQVPFDLDNGEAAVEEEGGEGGEWEDVPDQEDEDEEARCAIDRVLKKYEKAKVVDDDEGGGFDARYEDSIKEKMAEWKRSYYKVCGARYGHIFLVIIKGSRRNSRCMITLTRCTHWYIGMRKVSSG